MLNQEEVFPHRLAYSFRLEFHRASKLLRYDRPSPKLQGFLKKHYKLSNYVAQNNNFLIFDEYFNVSSASASCFSLTIKSYLLSPNTHQSIKSNLSRKISQNNIKNL